MIFEDDAYAKDDTVPKFNTIMAQLKKHDWDLFYLGRVLQKGTSDGKTLFPGVVEPGFSYCLFGYMLSRTGVKKLLQAGFDQDIIPVDEMVPASYMMHPRRDIARLYPPVLKAYAASPPLIFQRTKMEAGSDTETSKLWTAPPKIVVDQARHLFDQIYYINLDSRLDRRQNFESLGLPNVTRFSALTPTECCGVVAVSDDVKKNIETKSRRLHREIDCWEQVACAQSHLTIWQKLAASTDNRWLIFEDDVVVASGVQPNWLQKLEADYSSEPFDFDLLFLNVMKTPGGVVFRPLNEHFEWLGSFWGMHAYIITREAATKLLAGAYPISYQLDGYVSTKLSSLKMAVCRHPTVVQNEARFGTDVQKLHQSNLGFA